MASEQVNSPLTVDSTTNSIPRLTIAPANFRQAEERTARLVADRVGDQIAGLSNGQNSGRYLSSQPTETMRLENSEGRFYHVIGASLGGDLSVAAP